jgi:serine/threonine protein kinase
MNSYYYLNLYIMDSSPGDGNLESGSKGGKQGGSKDDYEVVDSAIGRGAYGRVHLVRKNGKLFAMKEIEKKKLAKEKKQYQAFVERELLMKINHPGIIKLNKCFQDAKYLCYILEYCDGGDLTKLIKTNQNRLTDELRIFYVA